MSRVVVGLDRNFQEPYGGRDTWAGIRRSFRSRHKLASGAAMRKYEVHKIQDGYRRAQRAKSIDEPVVWKPRRCYWVVTRMPV